jgi:hypothetical protein
MKILFAGLMTSAMIALGAGVAQADPICGTGAYINEFSNSCQPLPNRGAFANPPDLGNAPGGYPGEGPHGGFVRGGRY